MSIKVENNALVFQDKTRITFHRTLRIPQADNKVYPLPPNLGTFPICKVDDYINKVPESWRAHGGVFIPMFQAEAMWMNFQGNKYAPKAIQVGIGKVNAISGKPWSNSLNNITQDYAVIPKQPWLDGINSGNGYIKQFVAAPLGSGMTVEAQVTGKEDVGGMQIMVFNAKQNLQQPQMRRKKCANNYYYNDQACSLQYDNCYAEKECSSSSLKKKCWADPAPASSSSSLARQRAAPSVSKPSVEMGLAAGGNIKQQIYADPYGLHFWNQDSGYSRIFVHIVNSEMYYQITGKRIPKCTINAQTYAKYGYPWYNVYDENVSSVAASPILAQVKNVHQIQQEQGKQYAWPKDPYSISINHVKQIPYNQVRDGEW